MIKTVEMLSKYACIAVIYFLLHQFVVCVKHGIGMGLT